MEAAAAVASPKLNGFFALWYSQAGFQTSSSTRGVRKAMMNGKGVHRERQEDGLWGLC